jgi:glucose-6-phosphate isomerase
MLKVNLEHAFISEKDLLANQDLINKVSDMIQNKTGKGSEFTGWVDWPNRYDKEEFKRIQLAAKKIRKESKYLIVCGIGGSYLGAVSGIEMLKGLLPNDDFKVLFYGNTFSSLYSKQLLAFLADKDFSVNVISKSGTTTETSIAFRLLKELLIKKYGEKDAYARIYATTDKEKGTLKNEANLHGYQTFVIPDDIGGRFSVLTSVGLLPFAVSNIDINEILEGAKIAMEEFREVNVLNNLAYKYALSRYLLYKKGYKSELYVTYEPHFAKFSEWLKQLFGESEGKDGKGLLPDSLLFSTDLHSLGQFIQEGSKILYETNIIIKQPQEDILLTESVDNLDNLNYLNGKTLHYVNSKAFEGTLAAHYNEGNVPNIILEIDNFNAKTYGYLVYFFFISCACSAYLLDVNPFNQPGVEIYKRNMFNLLGKPK